MVRNVKLFLVFFKLFSSKIIFIVFKILFKTSILQTKILCVCGRPLKTVEFIFLLGRSTIHFVKRRQSKNIEIIAVVTFVQ